MMESCTTESVESNQSLITGLLNLVILAEHDVYEVFLTNNSFFLGGVHEGRGVIGQITVAFHGLNP